MARRLSGLRALALPQARWISASPSRRSIRYGGTAAELTAGSRPVRSARRALRPSGRPPSRTLGPRQAGGEAVEPLVQVPVRRRVGEAEETGRPGAERLARRHHHLLVEEQAL